MSRTSTVQARVQSVWAGGDRSTTARILAMIVLAALLVPLVMSLMASPAMAEDEEDNYSMYKLASNAAGYFSEAREPGSSLEGDWPEIAANRPGAAGALMGYGDSTVSEFARWMTAGLSGSTQTIAYDTLREGTDEGQSFEAMLTYAQFGAANRDLGLDSMSSSVMGGIVSGVGGSIVFVFYAVALAVSMLFWLVIQLLKILNPFMWFYQAISAISPTFAEGMVGGNPPGEGGALAGLSNFVSDWYGLIYNLAWQALVPLFVGVLLISLVLFKKMDRGGAIKKLVVRLLFIGLGLPLLGSMYTGVLDNFDDSLMGQHSGPTRVVLSTYVDFDAWAMDGRLHIPDEASIGWNSSKGQADPTSLMSVRTTALAINAQSHDVFSDMKVGSERSDAASAWEDGSAVSMSGEGDSASAVATTFGLLSRYISGAETTASDFESGIKGNLSETANEDQKNDWFIEERTYGDVDKFGAENDPQAIDAPMISTNGGGLKSTVDDSGYREFSSTGITSCGFQVHSEGDPISCNLSPLSMYNYLNSSFSADSMTAFSSENAMSGMVRETHASVSQVGVGPAAFMYWANAVVILGSLVVIGIWYAVGMVVASVRRTFGVVAAVPFATLGAVGAISKVVIYSIALILEVIVTLFMYQFISELLISIPGILSGPVSNVMSEDGLLGSYLLGSVVVIVLTLISTLIIMGITFALLRIRKQVLQAMDEMVTKLVDKFLDTSTAPKGDKGGMMPAMASGLGAGAGMAAGNKLANGFNGGGGGPKGPGGGSGGGPKGPDGSSTATNAGGLNPQAALAGGNGGAKMLEASKGKGDGGDGPGGPPNGSGGETREIGGGGSALGLPAGKDGPDGSDGQDQGGPLAMGSGGSGSRTSDKETAQQLNANGGLSNLGYGSSDAKNGQGAGGKGELVEPSGSGAGGQTDQGSDQSASAADGQPGHRGGGLQGQGVGTATIFGTGANAADGSSRSETGTKSGSNPNAAPLGGQGTAFGTGGQTKPGQSPQPASTESGITPGSTSGAAAVGGQGTNFGTGEQGQSGEQADQAPAGQRGATALGGGQTPTQFGTGQQAAGLLQPGQTPQVGGQAQQGQQTPADQRGATVPGGGQAQTQFGSGQQANGSSQVGQQSTSGQSGQKTVAGGATPAPFGAGKPGVGQGQAPAQPSTPARPAAAPGTSAPSQSRSALPQAGAPTGQAAPNQGSAPRFGGGQQPPNGPASTTTPRAGGGGVQTGSAQPTNQSSTTATPGGRSSSGAFVMPPAGGKPSGGQTINQRFTSQGVQGGSGERPAPRSQPAQSATPTTRRTPPAQPPATPKAPATPRTDKASGRGDRTTPPPKRDPRTSGPTPPPKRKPSIKNAPPKKPRRKG